MTTLIPWVGGKGKLLWVIDELAPHDYSCFVDVFGGSGTVTMNRPLKKGCMEVYNDYNSNLTNLMLCVKNRPLALIKELKFLPLHSRDDFDILLKFFRQEEFTDEYLEEELQLTEKYFSLPQANALKKLLLEKAHLGDVRRAANYFKLIRWSFSGTGSSFGGKPCDLRRFFHLIWECSRRLADVVVENRDFGKVIRQYDRKTTFFYCDPPYYEAERYYAVDFPERDHRRLHRILRKIKGFAMVSYNNSDFIRELYKEFYIFKTERSDSLSQKEGKKYEELIITNYNPYEHSAQIGLNLLEDTGYNCTLIHKPTKELQEKWRRKHQ